MGYVRGSGLRKRSRNRGAVGRFALVLHVAAGRGMLNLGLNRLASAAEARRGQRRCHIPKAFAVLTDRLQRQLDGCISRHNLDGKHTRRGGRHQARIHGPTQAPLHAPSRYGPLQHHLVLPARGDGGDGAEAHVIHLAQAGECPALLFGQIQAQAPAEVEAGLCSGGGPWEGKGDVESEEAHGQ